MQSPSKSLKGLLCRPPPLPTLNVRRAVKSRPPKESATSTAGLGMSRYSSHDPYLDPTSGVLKNRFGITDQKTLDEAEASLVAWRSYQLAQAPLKGKFDLTHLKAIHRHLFGDLYEWAGEIRTISLSRGSSVFAHPVHITTAAHTIFEQLANEKRLAGLDTTTFSKRAGYYLGEINVLHPFREGNGRTQREFISHLAYKNNYDIEWQNVTERQMTRASIAAFNGDSAQIVQLIERNLRPLHREETVPKRIRKTKPPFPKP